MLVGQEISNDYVTEKLPVNWCEVSIEVDPESVEPVTEMFRHYGGREVILEYPEPSKASNNVQVKTFLPC